ncbi:MAG: hypothetical protein RDV48_27760 [Candidatus Eremiobacteraeota bacterium]|nr:hypothetical protein [Candidatus Eremiobacteraeota bacterium]
MKKTPPARKEKGRKGVEPDAIPRELIHAEEDRLAEERRSIHFPECVVPPQAKQDYEHFIEWCLHKGITEIGHTVAPMISSKLRAKPVNIKEFDKKLFLEGAELDGSSFATGGGRVVHRSKVLAVPDTESKWFTFPDSLRRGTLYILSEMITPEGIPMGGRKPLRLASKVLEEALSELMTTLNVSPPASHERYSLITGFEKEFFVMPKDATHQRSDLKYLGQTVVGGPGPINQNLQGVYLTIPKRKEEALLNDIVKDLAHVGITAVQKHMEVGQTGDELKGRQCEIVLKYAPALNAADNELIARQVIEDVCERHGYRALIGSKSFTESAGGAGINGSGKHTNMSLVKYDMLTREIKENLLSLQGLAPDAHSPVNLIGLAMVAAMGRHWHVYDAAIASRGNDLRRRPGYEAPVYLSAFLGSTSEFRDSLQQDRNRSVSLGLSGNKLEWRAPGANTSMYIPLAFVCLGIAEVVKEINRAVKKSVKGGKSTTAAINDEFARLRKEINYFVIDEDVYELSKEDAEKRFGYKAPENTPEALEILDQKKKIGFLIEDGVFTEEMVKAFKMVQIENYVERVKAEAIVLSQMAKVLSNKVFRSALMAIPPGNLKEIEPRLRERQRHLGALNAELLMLIDCSYVEGRKDQRCKDLRTMLQEMKDKHDADELANIAANEILPLMARMRGLYEEIVDIIGGSEEVLRL